MMKTILIISFGAVCLTGCKRQTNDDQPFPTTGLSLTQRHQAVIAQTQLAAVDRLQSLVEREQAARHQAEEQTRVEQISENHWQLIAIVTGASLLSLIVGTVIGTNTRHETKKG